VIDVDEVDTGDRDAHHGVCRTRDWIRQLDDLE
jgi:hypothetical protein